MAPMNVRIATRLNRPFDRVLWALLNVYMSVTAHVSNLSSERCGVSVVLDSGTRNMIVRYTCFASSAELLLIRSKGAHVDQDVEGYEWYHGRLLHADDALSVLHLSDPAIVAKCQCPLAVLRE